MVVTEERFKLAVEMERIAKTHSVPKPDLLKIVEMAFHAGQNSVLHLYAAAVVDKAVA